MGGAERDFQSKAGSVATAAAGQEQGFHRIEVSVLPDLPDSRGAALLRDIQEDLGVELEAVRVIDFYELHLPLTIEDAERVAREIFCDPIIEHYAVDGSLAGNYSSDYLVKVGFRPGVTDNVAMTAGEAIAIALDREKPQGQSVHAGRLYLLKGCDEKTARHIAGDFLANGVIEEFRVYHAGQWGSEQVVPPARPLPSQGKADFIELNVGDEELMEISGKGLLSLSLQEMRVLRDYYLSPEEAARREEVGLPAMPSDVELETVAQTWSEHCKHKIFNATIRYWEGQSEEVIRGLFKECIRKATVDINEKQGQLLSVFTDNAGVVRLDEDWGLVLKVETHNHPSALDPYGGALTGIVGVNRDPLGTGIGARLIFNTDVFCFGMPDFPEESLPAGVLHPRRIFRGVRRGVEHGGNKMGVPTVNGAIVFDSEYLANPLVFCGTGGILPTRVSGKLAYEKRAEAGDLIVMVGGRIGKDGLHGATFSSASLEEEIPPMVVQIGAPIVQKKMMDALLEARDRDLYSCITDNGAGGLSSSVGEMAQLSGGCRVELDKAPTKYPGLEPWELWVSEAQERMTLAVPPEKIGEFLELMKSREVEATVIGEFTSEGRVHLLYKGRTVAYLSMEFLHEGLPPMELTARWIEPREDEPAGFTPPAHGEALKKILAHPSVASKEWVIRQYDHEVQGGSVVKPLVGLENDGPSDAAVIRPLLDREYGVAVACGINPRYSAVDTYWMAALAVDECLRNLVAVGADPDRVYLLDNFCWGNPVPGPENPDGEYKLAQLVRAAKACYDTATGYRAPFISGKDSFYNEFKWQGRTKAIPATLLISGMGLLDQCGKAVTMDAKSSGDLVYLLGETRAEMGGSHYYLVNGTEGGAVPRVDPAKNLALYRCLHQAINKGLVRSCHDLSEGGLAVSLAESAFAGGLGMDIKLAEIASGLADHEVLFSESAGRFSVTVSPIEREAFEREMAGQPLTRVGLVTEERRLRVAGKERLLVDESTDELKKVWQGTLEW